MLEWSKVYAKLQDTQLKKLKTAVKNKKSKFEKEFKKCLMKTIYPMSYY